MYILPQFLKGKDFKGRNKITTMQILWLSMNTALLQPALHSKPRIFCYSYLQFMNGDLFQRLYAKLCTIFLRKNREFALD